MSDYDFDWSVIEWTRLLDGLGVTLQIAAITIVLSMILAVPVGVARMSKIEIVRWVAQGYIEIFRGTPMLVQLFWIFFAMPALIGVTIGGKVSAIIALTANLTAFMAEAYRSGFQSVPEEQIEAGKMLRLNGWQRLRHIILPQSLRQQTPVILSLNITMFKDTALVSTIAVPDLMFQATTMSTETYRSLEFFTVVALIYFAIAFPVSLLISHLERRNLLASQGRTPPPKAKKPEPVGVAV